jgi:hypothetical protein
MIGGTWPRFRIDWSGEAGEEAVVLSGGFVWCSTATDFGIERGVAWLLFGCFYDFLLSVSELFRLVQFAFCNNGRGHLHNAVSLPVQ